MACVTPTGFDVLGHLGGKVCIGHDSLMVGLCLQLDGKGVSVTEVAIVVRCYWHDALFI